MNIIAERHRELAEMDRQLEEMRQRAHDPFLAQRLLVEAIRQELVTPVQVKPKVKKPKKKRTPWR